MGEPGWDQITGVRWFGPGWGADFCYDPDNEHVDTPVGKPCGYCGEAIEAGHSGVWRRHIDPGGGSWKPHHIECDLRPIVGSVAHQQRRCSCFGGTDQEEPGKTLRQAAIDAWVHFQKEKPGS